MSALFALGRRLTGQLGVYTIMKELQPSVWLASNQLSQTVVVKSARHWRLRNERDVLRRFYPLTPALRPLVDEIEEHPPDPPAIVLKHYDSDLLAASNAQRLTRREIRQVARSILEALAVLHSEGYVHTDVKPSNVLVNFGQGTDRRFADVVLADCGSTVHVDSHLAQEGELIGAAIFRSPEAHLQMRWGTATDIWSFGTTLLSLLWGHGWHAFRPDGVKLGEPGYEFKVMMKQDQYFGPFPLSYQEIADEETQAALACVIMSVPNETRKPFARLSEREIAAADKAFLLKVMKLDPRDRPTAQELLRDEWFSED